MESCRIHHFLIGLPGSGKSTFAQEVLATIDEDSIIISSDRAREELYGDASIQGNWQEIEAKIFQQLQSAIAQGKTIIYDATNAKRAHRLEWLQKVEASIDDPPLWVAWHVNTPIEKAKQWNKQRDREVPEGVIDRMKNNLKSFPPHPSEGFIQVNLIDVTNKENAKFKVKGVMQNLARSRNQQQNRTSNYELHRYSPLLDFERLIYLISLILKYPGLGNLQETAPETLQNLLGKQTATLKDELDEIQAVMARLRGNVYADKSAIAQDLEWLKINGFLDTTPINKELILEPLTPEKRDQFKKRKFSWHRYSDVEPFQRLLKLIRYIIHHPFPKETNPLLDSSSQGKSTLQENFFQKLQDEGVLVGHTLATIREDIKQVLKRYQILPKNSLKQGYFCGTGIFSCSELAKIYELLCSQQVYLDDPAAVEMAKIFRERIEAGKILDLKSIYPSRAIGNRWIVNPENLPSKVLPNQLEILESAIDKGEKIELALTPGSARFPDQPELDRFQAYPLQVVFHNIAWYLGFERVGGEQDGLFKFERLDRLTLEKHTQQTREFKQQLKSLEKLKQLYNASAGIFLGNNVSDQTKYLSKDKKERQAVQIDVELWMTEDIFKFVSEGTQRFAKAQMKMSRLPNQVNQNIDQSIFRLANSKDSRFPYRFRVTLPIWSLKDVDLKRWILGFGKEVKVVQPIEFRQKIAEEFDSSRNNYLP